MQITWKTIVQTIQQHTNIYRFSHGPWQVGRERERETENKRNRQEGRERERELGDPSWWSQLSGAAFSQVSRSKAPQPSLYYCSPNNNWVTTRGKMQPNQHKERGHRDSEHGKGKWEIISLCSYICPVSCRDKVGVSRWILPWYPQVLEVVRLSFSLFLSVFPSLFCPSSSRSNPLSEILTASATAPSHSFQHYWFCPLLRQ